MTTEAYVELIRRRLEANFKIDAPGEEDGVPFLLIAQYHNVSGRIFLTRKDIIDQYETFETCYLKEAEYPEQKDIEDYFQLIAEKAVNLQPGKDHFHTDLTGVLICHRTPVGTEKLVKKLNYERLYRFFWRGFSTVRFVCVDLERKKVYTNRSGKEIKKVYQW